MQDNKEKEKKEIEEMKEKLFYKRENVNLKLSDELLKQAREYCEQYKEFLNCSKTERKACEYAQMLAKEKGFELFSKDKKYNPGDRAYFVNRDKNVVLLVFGNKSINEGVKLAIAHIDSPRLDLKPNPVFEEDEIGYFKTHYYGGIKKYQWTTIPLSLYGVVFKADGEKVDVCIGEDENDPVFCISDLLPHLAENQYKKSVKEFIDPESLNIIVGSCPFKKGKEADMVKLNVLKILNEKYGITERDFLSAEFEVVPTFKARDVGFDGSLIGAYGQDDRVCAYNSLRAILDCNSTPTYTAITMLVDKEEIGSCGNTGMESNFFEYFINDLGEMFGVSGHTILSNSECMSADVGAAYDPNYKEVFEDKNCAHFGYGTIITKYTGRGGKSSASDASSEFVDKVTRLLDKKEISWQMGELGRIDIGGGGTVAMFVAKLNMDVVDVGVALLSMHSPYEISSKVDIFENYRAIHAFLTQE